MTIWVILEMCCGEYHSAWTSEDKANKRCEELNAELVADDADPNFYVRRSTLNG